MTLQVLFIDDEAQCVELASVYLYHDFPDCSLAHAVSCEQGLAMLEAGSFDVCLVDQRLPPSSGFDCLKEIRLRWKELPIVLVTGFEWPEGFEERCIEEGVDGFVHKDAMKMMLAPVIHVALRLRKNLLALGILNAQREEHLKFATTVPEKLRKQGSSE